MVKRVWNAAKGCKSIDKVIVAWPERYPDLDENNVLERFKRISKEFPSNYIIRLTADCPLLSTKDIYRSILRYYNNRDCSSIPWHKYYSNHKDGRDVQIFNTNLLSDMRYTHKEHVINDMNTQSTGFSVNTKEDLERIRLLAK